MKFCSDCGLMMSDDDKVCPKCGGASSLDTTSEKSIEAASFTTTPSYIEPSSYNKVFVESDEQLLGTLGNGYLESLLNKKVKKCHALLTDKRLYFQGTFFSGSGKTLQQDIVEKIVDLEDITGTGFRYSRPFGKLFATRVLTIVGIVSFVAFFCTHLPSDGYATWYSFYMSILTALAADFIPALIFVIQYIKSRKTDFILEYAGGSIRFNATIIGLSHVKDFNKQIRRAKDKAKGKN